MFEAIIPAANPDFEYLYEDVSVWWLELDENGIPVREIGFNLSGQPIVAAPLGENFGVFTDSAVPCNGFNLLNESQFNEQWRYFVRLWDEERK
ncbi:MAG TPA: hypothetical protein VFV64_04210 [Permianibacter sp.]|nr:hypothetical protein [Permianibacter sp.]